MRALHFDVRLVADALRFWAVVGGAHAAHARLGRCTLCHAVVRLDDRPALTTHGIAHAECARWREAHTHAPAGGQIPGGMRRCPDPLTSGAQLGASTSSS